MTKHAGSEEKELARIKEEFQAGHLTLNSIDPLTDRRVLATPLMETRVVAYLARGDTYRAIQKQIAEDFDGYKIDPTTIKRIKDLHIHTFDLIHQKIVKFEAATAMELVKESRNMIAGRLKGSQEALKVIEHAAQEYIDGEITLKEYLSVVRLNPQVTTTELVAISKEMFTQHSKETGIDDDDDNARSRTKLLNSVATAIKDGKVKVLERLVFEDAESNTDRADVHDVSEVGGSEQGGALAGVLLDAGSETQQTEHLHSDDHADDATSAQG